MEKQITTSVQQQKKANQSSKAKKKPVKVVYISNPMKVKANSTADFRALVQELTGRDADPSKYAATEDADDFMVLPAAQQQLPAATSSMASSSSEAPTPTGNILESEASKTKTDDGGYDIDDVSTPQLIDNYAVFSPTTMFGDLHDVYGYGKI